MSMGLHVLSGRKDGNAHRLSSAAAGTEMCSMDEGIGVPSQCTLFHGLPKDQNANFVPWHGSIRENGPCADRTVTTRICETPLWKKNKC